MEWTWPESVSSDRQRVMEELVQGREMVNKLRRALSGDVVSSPEELATQILGSFTNTLMILNGNNHEAKEELVSQIHQEANSNSSTTSTVTAASPSSAAAVDSSSWATAHDDAVKSEDSHDQESSKRNEPFKDRRGSYKRRKASHSWTKDTLDWIDDGHSWRKYGQKPILNKRHPRNYFRCTHKFDQGCKATKHEQIIKDEPQLFRTTYYGNHTCTDYLRAPELILDCSSPIESSKNMIRFDNTNNDVDFTSKQEHPFFSFFTSNKKENVKEEMITAPVSHLDHMNTSHHNQSLSSGDYVVSQTCLGVPTFESSDPICGFSSFDQYDEADVMEQLFYDIGFSYEI